MNPCTHEPMNPCTHEPLFGSEFEVTERYVRGCTVFLVHVEGFDFWLDTTDRDIPIGIRTATRRRFQWMQSNGATSMAPAPSHETKALVFNLISLL